MSRRFVFMTAVLLVLQGQAWAQYFPSSISTALYAGREDRVVLLPGQKLLDSNCTCRAEMQEFGNFVIIRKDYDQEYVEWQTYSDTGERGGYVALEPDGRLALYNARGDELDNTGAMSKEDAEAYGFMSHGLYLKDCQITHRFVGYGVPAWTNYTSYNEPWSYQSECPTEQGTYGLTSVTTNEYVIGGTYYTAFDYGDPADPATFRWSACAMQCSYDLPYCRGFEYIPPEPSYPFSTCVLYSIMGKTGFWHDGGWMVGIVKP